MPPAPPSTARGGGLVVVAGLPAVSAPDGVMVPPVRMVGLDASGVASSLPSLQWWLFVATLVYLVAGTAFYVTRYE